MSQRMRFPTMRYVRPAMPQISLRIRAVWSEPLLIAWSSTIIKLLTKHQLRFLSFKGGCTGSSGSTHVKMRHCWKTHVAAHMVRGVYNDVIMCKLNQDTCMCNQTLPHPKFQTTNILYHTICLSVMYFYPVGINMFGLLGKVWELEVFDYGID